MSLGSAAGAAGRILRDKEQEVPAAPVAAVAAAVGRVFLGKVMPEVRLVAVPAPPVAAPEARGLPIQSLDRPLHMAVAVAKWTAQVGMRVEELARQGSLVALPQTPLQIVAAVAVRLALAAPEARVALAVPGSY